MRNAVEETEAAALPGSCDAEAGLAEAVCVCCAQHRFEVSLATTVWWGLQPAEMPLQVSYLGFGASSAVL